MDASSGPRYRPCATRVLHHQRVHQPLFMVGSLYTFRRVFDDAGNDDIDDLEVDADALADNDD